MPMRSLDDFAVRKLAELDRASLRRTLAESFRGEGPWIERDGRRYWGQKNERLRAEKIARLELIFAPPVTGDMRFFAQGMSMSFLKKGNVVYWLT
jgi:hypothetical protein